MTMLQRIAIGAVTATALVMHPGAGTQAQTVIEEWASAKLPAAARAQAGDHRSQRDRPAGDGFHQPDLHQGAPAAVRGLGGESARAGDARRAPRAP